MKASELLFIKLKQLTTAINDTIASIAGEGIVLKNESDVEDVD